MEDNATANSPVKISAENAEKKLRKAIKKSATKLVQVSGLEANGIEHMGNMQIFGKTVKLGATPTGPMDLLAPRVVGNINATPHDIHIYDKEGKTLLNTYKSEKPTIRLEECPSDAIAVVDGVGAKAPVKFGAITGIKDYYSRTGDNLIVSGLCGAYIRDNPKVWKGKVVSPDDTTTGAVRDSEGNIIGTKGWIIWKEATISEGKVAKVKERINSINKFREHEKKQEEKKNKSGRNNNNNNNNNSNSNNNNNNEFEGKTKAVESQLKTITSLGQETSVTPIDTNVVSLEDNDLEATKPESNLNVDADESEFKEPKLSKRKQRNLKFIDEKKKKGDKKGKEIGESETLVPVNGTAETVMESAGKVALGYPIKE